MSDLPRFELRFDDPEALAREIEVNLGRGRAFVRGATGLETFSPCVVVLVHPEDGRLLELQAEVVLPPEQQEQLGGVGLEVRVPGDALLAFLSGDDRVPLGAPVDAADAPMEPASTDAAGWEDDAFEEASVAAEEVPLGEGDVLFEDDAELGDGDEALAESPEARSIARNAMERVRRLNLAEQLRVARGGELADRMALERLFGRNVWEALLANPKITVAEVAKIGRKGSVPRPLLDAMVGNAGWLRAGIVRRALLTNPRLSREGMEKVLRMTPRAELKAIEKQVTYPPTVRELARKLLAH